MAGKKRVELLAPAGNAEGFYGAVHAGADAVYLGGSRFGARAYAENFTTQELVECIRYGHLLGRKIYLTVNTLLKGEEIAELSDYLQPFYEAGLDAVIVQDLGVLGCIRRCFPEVELHASTQMTLCSHYGAELLKALGVSRIVPARELSLQELSEIRSRVDVELEAFIHGAMCYCYSGQCLFSSILGGRSGNRGRCAQPCRLPYQVGKKEKESCYPLSLKDMCTVEHIPDLIEAGIDSFKIEGRMKKPEYTAGVTAVYRKYIDRYYELREQLGREQAKERYQVSTKDMEDLSSLYIRSGKQDGYYFKQNGKEMITLTDPAYSGNNEKLLEEIRRRYLRERLRLPVTVKGSFATGKPAEVTLEIKGGSVTVQGTPVDRAQKQPVTEENIRKQLGKMGDSAFIPEHMELTVDKDAFYPLKQINELRREAIFRLEQSILERKDDCPGRSRPGDVEGKFCFQDTRYKAGFPDLKENGYPQRRQKGDPHPITGAGIAVSVRTFSQLKKVTGFLAEHGEKNFKRLYIDSDLFLEQPEETAFICQRVGDRVERYMALPYIMRQKDHIPFKALLEAAEHSSLFHGMLVRSLDELAAVGKRGYRCRLDAGVYGWNPMALEELQGMTEGFCLPLELKAGEQKKLLESYRSLSGGKGFEKLVYGRLPMMVTANCLWKTTGKCSPKERETMILTDRYRKEFPVVRNCRYCMNIIYNSVPLSLHRNVEEWYEWCDIRLDFTTETGDETLQVLKGFLEKGELPYDQYTTGHEKRGVE